jgi:hypothetical protein
MIAPRQKAKPRSFRGLTSLVVIIFWVAWLLLSRLRPRFVLSDSFTFEITFIRDSEAEERLRGRARRMLW